MQTDGFAIEESRRANDLFARWAVWIVVATILAWESAGESSGRYIIYTVPPLLVIVHLALSRFRPQLDAAPLVALGLYSLAVFASLAVNPHVNAFTQRDLLIIFGYIVVFCLYLKAPAAIADVLLVGLSLGLLIEARREGVTLDISFAGSQGIVESVLAFPLGALLIYYLSQRRWGRALLTGLVFLVAFKRIALIGVGAAVALDFLTRHLSVVARRRMFIAVVIFGCLFALFSVRVFDELATLLGSDSSNAISLGRYQIATELWTKFSQGDGLHWLFGYGPGAADTWVAQMDQVDELRNPHNDWLKILVDYGAFGLILWNGILARFFPANRLGNQLYLYAGVLMITDNTLIYLFHFAVAFLISRIEPSPQVEPLIRSQQAAAYDRQTA